MVCRSSRLVTGNSGLCAYSTLANTECQLYLFGWYSVVSFQHKMRGIFGLRVPGPDLVRAWGVLRVCFWGIWFVGFWGFFYLRATSGNCNGIVKQMFCLFSFNLQKGNTGRGQRNKAGVTARSVRWSSPLPKVSWPKRVWFSLLNVWPTEMPSHYFLMFTGLSSFAWFI